MSNEPVQSDRETHSASSPYRYSKGSDVTDSKLFQLIATVYGPYAFGVASLLLIWFTIVSPQLDRQAINYERNEAILDTLKSVANTSLEISRTLERTSLILENAVNSIKEHTP